MTDDETYMRRAIELALLAEEEGNLPIGAVIVLDGRLVGEGRNAIWVPAFDASRHAEMEALRAVPDDLRDSAREMTLYTTLEPCLMCLGAILLHRIGRVVYGAADGYGGAGPVIGHLPPYFRERMAETDWSGPALPGECGRLNERLQALVQAWLERMG